MYLTEKEMSLRLCKMFDAMMASARKDGDVSFDSISTFLNHGCDCPKSTNGYFQWACSTRQCQNCKNSKPAALKCQTSDDMVTVSQFESVAKEYSSTNKVRL